MPRLHPHDALIHLMVVTSAADRDMNDRELLGIGNVVRHWPVFEGFDEERIISVAQRCHAKIAEASLAKVVGDACAAIPERLADTAYAAAFEVAAVDLEMRFEELRVLELVRNGLGLPKQVIDAIERGAKARSRMLT